VRNWTFFLHLRAGLLKGIPIVVTSTNAGLVRRVLEPDMEVFEVVETPSELQKILHAVRITVGQEG
jgi:hypothetical protein